jgi:predicted DNA-binding protein (MmcQ/YjbR family)
MGLKPRSASLPAEASPAFAVLQSLCAALDGVEERWAWGHPNFDAGDPPRCFAAFERVKGAWIAAVRVGPDLRDALLAQGDPYGPVPYDRAGEWIGVATSPSLDRDRLAPLVAEAHAAVLLPRTRKRR